MLDDITKTLLKGKFISLMDLTNLNETAAEKDIITLCEKADAANVAAVCIYPQFINIAKTNLRNSEIAVCTVANFPSGDAAENNVLQSIDDSLALGATEIDVVLPYKDYLAGNTQKALQLIERCREIVPVDKTLKVILETGIFTDADQLYNLCLQLIDLDVNFLKTSTGKLSTGASSFAAEIMLQAIKESDKNVGFKASGGIHTFEQALLYYNLAIDIFSDSWITPKHFRFGASSLLDLLL